MSFSSWVPAAVPSFVSGLKPEQRQALAQKLRTMLPLDNSGRIALTARAWAIKAVVL